MEIRNGCDSRSVSWFTFNANDLVKLVALASGDLKAGEWKTLTQPIGDKPGHKYCLRFNNTGGGTELCSGDLKDSQTGTITENNSKAWVMTVTGE